jgi:flagellar assembly protein FliH
MLSRVIDDSEAASLTIQTVVWPALDVEAAPVAAVDPGEIESLKMTLAKALDELSEARQRIQELEAAGSAMEAAAFEKGRQEGQQEAEGKAEQERSLLLERISRAIAEVASLRGRIREDAEKDLVKLALAIARRITHREISMDGEALLGVVRSALARMSPGELTKVSIHPSATDVVRRQLQQMNVPSSVEVAPDASLQPGDMYLETSGGMLDASIDTQLKEIERGFCDRLSN